ncbi:MAG: hypothetical protein VKJ27_11355 [Synechocystis sp.]|nr:hypothetical protein [Synechocystis sp.]
MQWKVAAANPSQPPPPNPASETAAKSVNQADVLRKMPVSAFKAQLLVSLAIQSYKNGDRPTAINYLDQAQTIAAVLTDPTEKVTTLIRLVEVYNELRDSDTVQALLTAARLTINAQDSLQRRSELLLTLSLAYEELNDLQKAQETLQESIALLQAEQELTAQYPFKEEPLDASIGLSGQFNSYRDTTAFIGINVDVYKQWEKEDLAVDGTFYIDYDSSRSVNNFRPGSLSTLVYRDHLNDDWSFFVNTFISTNQDLYASSNNDEDLEIIAVSYLGAGLNLWRGKTPKQFLDFQMGLGPRYEHSYVNFDQVANQIAPVLGLILYGRGFEIGKIAVDSTFYVSPVLSNFNRWIIGSDSRFNIPLGAHWSFTNRLFVRYQSEPIVIDTPNIDVFLSTGVEYTF